MLGGGTVTYVTDLVNSRNNPYTIQESGHYILLGQRGRASLDLTVNGVSVNPTKASEHSSKEGTSNMYVIFYDLNLNAGDVLGWWNLAMILKVD